MFSADNISLRKLEPQDLPFLYQWENDSAVWMASDTHNPLSQKDLRDYIMSSTGDIYRDGQLRLIIERKSQTRQGESITVGCIDFFDFDPHNGKAALGVYVEPEARRVGIGFAAVRLMEEYAFDFLNLRMLYAYIPEQNMPSIALFTKCGWQQTAVLPAWLRNQSVVVMQKCIQWLV